jgi:hypothetical protein
MLGQYWMTYYYSEICSRLFLPKHENEWDRNRLGDYRIRCSGANKGTRTLALSSMHARLFIVLSLAYSLIKHIQGFAPGSRDLPKTVDQNIIMAEETAPPTETSITCPCGKSTVKTTAAPVGACICHCFECRKITQGMFRDPNDLRRDTWRYLCVLVPVPVPHYTLPVF